MVARTQPRASADNLRVERNPAGERPAWEREAKLAPDCTKADDEPETASARKTWPIGDRTGLTARSVISKEMQRVPTTQHGWLALDVRSRMSSAKPQGLYKATSWNGNVSRTGAAVHTIQARLRPLPD
jgi:hypothetical protein